MFEFLNFCSITLCPLCNCRMMERAFRNIFGTQANATGPNNGTILSDENGLEDEAEYPPMQLPEANGLMANRLALTPLVDDNKNGLQDEIECPSMQLIDTNDIGAPNNLTMTPNVSGLGNETKNEAEYRSKQLSDANGINVPNELLIAALVVDHKDGIQDEIEGPSSQSSDTNETDASGQAMASNVADKPSSGSSVSIECGSVNCNQKSQSVTSVLLPNRFKQNTYVHLKLLKKVPPIESSNKFQTNRRAKPVVRLNYGNIQCAVCKKKFRVDVSSTQSDDGGIVCSLKCLKNA